MLRQIFGLITLLVLAGCDDEQPHRAKSAEGVSPFSVQISASPVVDGHGSLLASISTHGDFHFNKEYPTHFSAAADAGVSFAEKKLDLRDRLEFIACPKNSQDACKTQTSIPFQADGPIKGKVIGTLAFSVCNADKCLIEKFPVSIGNQPGR